VADLNRALFLDRDGVINIDHGYVCTREQFDFVDGIFELGRRAAELGYLIVVVTNQAGIGRGYYTEQQFLELTDWMCRVFRERGVPVAKVHFCPFHPEHGIGSYRIDSIDRKPGPGMIVRAARDLEIDLAESILLGDKESDIEAGVAAGIACNVLYSPHNGAVPSPSSTIATATVTRLIDAIPYMSNRSPGGACK